MEAATVNELVAAAEGAPVAVTIPAVFSFSRSASVAELVGLAMKGVNRKPALATLRLGSNVFRAGTKSLSIRAVRAAVSASSAFEAGKANQATGSLAFMPGTLRR